MWAEKKDEKKKKNSVYSTVARGECVRNSFRISATKNIPRFQPCYNNNNNCSEPVRFQLLKFASTILLLLYTKRPRAIILHYTFEITSGRKRTCRSRREPIGLPYSSVTKLKRNEEQMSDVCFKIKKKIDTRIIYYIFNVSQSLQVQSIHSAVLFDFNDACWKYARSFLRIYLKILKEEFTNT